jgi:hypothetical protein
LVCSIAQPQSEGPYFVALKLIPKAKQKGANGVNPFAPVSLYAMLRFRFG